MNNQQNKGVRILFSLLSVLLLVSVVQPSHATSAKKLRGIQQQPQEAAAPLHNKDVVEMVKTGLSTDIIVAKIKNSVSEFDTSPAALQELKAAGVPEPVILAMVQAPSGTLAAKTAVANEPANGKAEAGDSMATVYVYRKKNFGTRNMQPSVYADEVEVARMDDGKYFIIKLAPGKHKIEVNKGHSGAEIDMKAGEQYYFRVEMIPGFWKARGSIDFIQKEQGALEIQKMKPLEAKWIKDKSRVTVADLSTKPQ
jgi:hypothetical protein